MVTFAAAALALTAAALHAGWNVGVKDSVDRLATLWAILAVAGLLSVPVLLVAGLPAAAALQLLAPSIALHVAYDLLMLRAYGATDLSVAYPLARGAAPALVALGGVVWLGDRLPPSGAMGIAVVSAGLLALASGRPDRTGLLVAAAAAIMLAGYTLVDGAAVRLSGGSLSVAALLFVVHGVVMTLLTLLRRTPGQLAAHVRDRGWRLLAGGIAASVGYLCVLAALRLAPAGLVAALRETSVVLATALGGLLLREPLPRMRIIAAAVIAIGSGVLLIPG